MDMIRSFLPVGQGAFYTEQFDDGTNVIYDCGSENGIRMIEEMIKSTFHEGDIIHAVFISHMHSDHMNGLEFLLQYCNVKTIYLPFLSQEERRVSSLIQEITPNTTDFVRDFMHNPEDTLRRYLKDQRRRIPQVKFVLPKNLNGISPEERERTISQQVYSGDEIAKPGSVETTNWVYIPFNLQNAERKKIFTDKLKSMGIDINNWKNVQKLLRSEPGREQFRKAYDAVPGKLNTNSLVIYSGPDPGKTGGEIFQVFQHPNGKWHLDDSISPGCLYLGDFDARTKGNYAELEDSYTGCWNNVGVLQIPHHGSKHNFNSKLLSKADCFVISAGSVNRYKHPHVFVLKEIVLHRKPCVWVTEKNSSIGRFRVQ